MPTRGDGVLRVVTRILLGCTLFWPALSAAQTAREGTPSTQRADTHRDPGIVGFDRAAELQNRPRSDFENSLMGELACTCGDCKLELINSCRCEFAAKMRGELLAQLEGLDLSTEAARLAGAEAVRASFVARYGPKAMDRMNRLDPNGLIAGSVVGAVVVSFFVVMLSRRWNRGRARQGR